MRLSFLAGTALACAITAAPLRGAPLDALLTALSKHGAATTSATARWDVEVGIDQANKALDVLGMRPKRADGSYGPSGLYNGGHLQAGVQLAPSLRVEGGLWKRDIQYVSASADVTSWQLAGQWRMLESTKGDAALALRAGAWGNSAPLLRRTSSATVQGITFTSAQASKPRDTQLQIDLLATWQMAPSVQATAFIGAGRSRVDFDEVHATTGAAPACVYDVRFTDGKVIATCEQNGSSTRVSTPASVYGIDVDKEARYSANSLSVGANAVWQPGHSGNWRLRAGVQFIRLDRGSVDEVVLSRGGTPFTSNTIIVTDIGYRLRPLSLPTTWLFVRAQVMAHQFVGEAPLMYNTLTATQHRRRYGFATLGVQHSF